MATTDPVAPTGSSTIDIALARAANTAPLWKIASVCPMLAIAPSGETKR